MLADGPYCVTVKYAEASRLGLMQNADLLDGEGGELRVFLYQCSECDIVKVLIALLFQVQNDARPCRFYWF